MGGGIPDGLGWVTLITAMLGSYLVGSLNLSIIVSKVFYKTDIRTLGSGNAGATNVLRNFGRKAAIPVFAFDVLKGVIGYLIGLLICGTSPEWAPLICAFAAILGHIFPVFYGFKGGKGVSTTLGVCLVAAPLATLITFAIVVVIFAVGKRISLGSILGILIFTVLSFVLDCSTAVTLFGAAMTVIIWFKHKENIKRLLNGEEPKFSLKK